MQVGAVGVGRATEPLQAKNRKSAHGAYVHRCLLPGFRLMTQELPAEKSFENLVFTMQSAAATLHGLGGSIQSSSTLILEQESIWGVDPLATSHTGEPALN